MNLAKEVEKLREQLAALRQKRRVCLFLNIERDWTMQQIQAAADDLVAKAVAAGHLDPLTQEPLVVRFWTKAENDAASDRVWNPEAGERAPKPQPLAMEALEPIPEPKPEKPTPIDYPPGLAPY
jgi:hypothetical protein